ncbi:hypothetical protein LTR20_007468 [Exophiala xenobiotica]|nr:hypothetical protein LTS13_007994 [Exophiala xenobiotica]KAK5401331.1 hypothetical protein LTR79_001850 [Exophiala xenobiotica]KAK5407026.1 hypothetical protein LTR90_010283 [Exophiala xenobiotica]KAK5460161.1 hypothetical protein LTR20_007468 [Exophiala xenobiotica]KAK5501312.1 hypothetical protein LTR26_001005 [Exophiala xenobiotica]
MGCGILESRSGIKHVPGTNLLDTHDVAWVDQSTHLKRGTGKNSHILLVPQPSNSPNDPLNWPLWQRDLILLLYCYATVLCIGGIGPILSSMALILIEDLGISFTQVSLLTGYSLCATGAVGIFVSALARKYGKRPCLLFSATCAFAGTLWGGAANSYGSLLGARVVQGLGVAMFESVMFSVVGDLYYVHERGSRMAIYVTANSGIANLPAMLAGKITIDLGWRWVFWLLAIFLGTAWAGVVFFGWETAYNRNSIYNIDTSSQENIEMIEEVKAHTSTHVEANQTQGLSSNEQPANIEKTTTASTANTIEARDSFLKRMKPVTGTFTEESILKMVVRPFFILLNPAVLWAVISIAIPTLWLVGFSFVIAQIFSAPPYLLNTQQLGYLSAGPVVGGTLGCIVAGWIADPITKYISRRNKGVYEPEFRLTLMIPSAILSVLGYFLFGGMIEEGKPAAGMAAIWALVLAGLQFLAVAIGNYMVDAYRNISVEVFIISMVFKNFLFFGFSFFLNDWVASWGPQKFFNFIGGVQLALYVTTIPMYIFGKRLRAWWHSHDVLSKI